jgi:hypothetical protein
MTPRDVDALSGDEYRALVRYAVNDLKRQQRAARQAQRKR